MKLLSWAGIVVSASWISWLIFKTILYLKTGNWISIPTYALLERAGFDFTNWIGLKDLLDFSLTYLLFFMIIPAFALSDYADKRSHK